MARAWAFVRVVFGRGEIKPSSGKKGGDIMRDVLTSAVKSAVQVGVAAFAAWLFSLGIDIGAGTTALESGLLVVIMGVVTAALNWLGKKFPWINQLVSLGLSKSTATY